MQTFAFACTQSRAYCCKIRISYNEFLPLWYMYGNREWDRIWTRLKPIIALYPPLEFYFLIYIEDNHSGRNFGWNHDTLQTVFRTQKCKAVIVIPLAASMLSCSELIATRNYALLNIQNIRLRSFTFFNFSMTFFNFLTFLRRLTPPASSLRDSHNNNTYRRSQVENRSVNVFVETNTCVILCWSIVRNIDGCPIFFEEELSSSITSSHTY